MAKPIAILIDDEPDIRELLAISLKRMGIDSIQAGSFNEGLSLINATGCDLCITDVRMPDGSGLDLVKQFKQRHPNIPIAVMTAFDTTDIAIQAMKAGAFDFLAKPIRAKRLETLIEDIQLTSKETFSDPSKQRGESIIGDSESIKSLRLAANKASQSMAPIVVLGESGTGKELLARSIHNQSPRKYGPFVSANCSAIPIELLESEFFGHEKGSFPEAHRKKMGLFQAAKGGSLVLNEVSSLPPYFQVKLLSALQDRSAIALGSNETYPIDVRLICTADSNFESDVQNGIFREDLFYQLSVIELFVPPLRDRREDILLICDYLLDKNSAETAPRLSPDAQQVLTEYNYPGNIRELDNILRRSLAMSSEEEISKANLQFPPHAKAVKERTQGVKNPLQINDLEEHMDQQECEIITAVLEAEKWNQTKAAKRLNLTPRQFRYKLTKYGLKH